MHASCMLRCRWGWFAVATETGATKYKIQVTSGDGTGDPQAAPKLAFLIVQLRSAPRILSSGTVRLAG